MGMMTAFMTGGRPGWLEIGLVVLLLLLLFGAKRVPELARALGRSLSEFKKGRQGEAPEQADASSGKPSVASNEVQATVDTENAEDDRPRA